MIKTCVTIDRWSKREERMPPAYYFSSRELQERGNNFLYEYRLGEIFVQLER